MKQNEENPYLEIFGQKFFKNGSNFADLVGKIFRIEKRKI